MLTYQTAYGIMLTDGYGKFLYEGIKEIVEQLGGFYEQDKWTVYCSTVERPQLLLGFNVKIHKGMDFKVIEEKWQEHLKNLPPLVKEWFDQFEEFNADIKIMVGEH